MDSMYHRLQYLTDQDRILFNDDAKCATEKLIPPSSRQGRAKAFRCPPPGDSVGQKRKLEAVFGAAEDRDENTKRAWEHKGAQSLYFAWDARRRSRTRNIEKLLPKLLKAPIRKGTVFMPFRLMYRPTLLMQRLDPIETNFIISTPKMKLKTVQRQWLDLPGDNMVRGLSNVPTMSSDPGSMVFKILWATKRAALADCQEERCVFPRCRKGTYILCTS